MPAQTYEVRVTGHLEGSEWSEWFQGFTLRPGQADETVLFGLVSDQAALHGLLARIRDLGLSLVSINRVEARDDEPVSGGRTCQSLLSR